MGEYRIIEVKQSVFAANEKSANQLREEMKKKGTLLVNLISSPSSGKLPPLKRPLLP